MPTRPHPLTLPRFAIAAPAAVLAMWLACATEANAQQRQRTPPPEPSRQAWISADGQQALAQAIERHQAIVAGGGWPTLPDRVTLRAGDASDAVAKLRRRLEVSGDVRRRSGDGSAFDSELEDGVKRYQTRNGLEPTGIVYGITQRSLNVPAETRLRQLQLNLQRMQKLTPALARGPKYILMNSASAELQGIAGGQVEIVSRTIAGKRATPTPDVSTSVQAINTLPYWHVPASIAKAALIPAVRKDPSYLYRERIRVFSTFGGGEIDPATVNWWGPEAERYVFRQDPGPQNALGVLRFDMPNKHIVYMHDTPMKNLFNYHERAYSAGCVRVQRFLELAAWVLGGQDGWTAQGLGGLIDASSAKTIKVKAPVPVHFIYLTAWVDKGGVQFRNDLYNRDDGPVDGGEDTAARPMTTSIAP
jgi:murein L,D-transpeptidase YcbB/YkuD